MQLQGNTNDRVVKLKPSIIELRAVFDYNQDTGVITWKSPTNVKIKSGSVAGSLKKSGYIDIKYKGSIYKAHRIAWALYYGYWPIGVINHLCNKFASKSDNRISNLEDTTVEGNQHNVLRRDDNTSGVTGVTWDQKCSKWRARITVNGNREYLGSFDSLEEAAAKRYEAAYRYGFSKNHGVAK